MPKIVRDIKKYFLKIKNILDTDFNESKKHDRDVLLFCMCYYPFIYLTGQSNMLENKYKNTLQYVSYTYENREDLKYYFDYIKNIIQNIRDVNDFEVFIRGMTDTFLKVFYTEHIKRHGVSYTPIQLSDFQVRISDYLLRKFFDSSIGSDDVCFFDPFSGYGVYSMSLMKYLYNRQKNIKIQFSEITFYGYVLSLLSCYYLCDLLDIQCDIRGIQTDSFEYLLTYRRDNIQVYISNPPYGGSFKQDIYDIVKSELKKYVSDVKNIKIPNTYIHALVLSIQSISKGIISYVIPSNWVYDNTFYVFRKYLENNSKVRKVYIINTRGDSKKTGVTRKKEGDNIFSNDSKEPICFVFIVIGDYDIDKQILYYEFQDYMNLESKISLLNSLDSLETIHWLDVSDRDGYWIHNIVQDYDNMIPLEKEDGYGIFKESFFGLMSGDDKNKYELFDTGGLIPVYYRIGQKRYVSIDILKKFDSTFRIDKNVFLRDNICIIYSTHSEFVYFVDNYFDRVFCSYGPTRCLPLYLYKDSDLFTHSQDREYNITDYGLGLFRDKYGEDIRYEDIFYYVLGCISNQKYLNKYKDMIMTYKHRVKLVNTRDEFNRIVEVSKNMSKIMIQYDELEPYDIEIEKKCDCYDIQKIVLDEERRMIYYNKCITIKNIPEYCFYWRVGDISYLKLFVNAYSKRYTKSGLVFDPNVYIRQYGEEYVINQIRKMITLCIEIYNHQVQIDKIYSKYI